MRSAREIFPVWRRHDPRVLLFTLFPFAVRSDHSALWPALRTGSSVAAVGTGPQLADRAIQNFLVVGEFAIALVLPENAFVVWRECAVPWRMEEELISTICVPLNLDQNRSNRFHPVVSERRRLAIIRARDLPISCSGVSTGSEI